MDGKKIVDATAKLSQQEKLPEQLLRSRGEQFEREQLSRRQALRKFGFTAGMAAFAMFSVDDLARLVGKVLERKARDNQVVNQVAQEFKEAGIVLAEGPLTLPPTSGPCTDFMTHNTQANCYACNEERHNYCSGTAKCPDSQCNPPYNCGLFICGNPGYNYGALGECWSSVCGACLANCS